MDVHGDGPGGVSGFDYFKENNEQPNIKKTEALVANALSSVRKRAKYIVSAPRIQDISNNPVIGKKTTLACKQSIATGSHTLAKMKAADAIHQCVQMTSLDLAEAIGEQANQLGPQEQKLFWNNISAFCLNDGSSAEKKQVLALAAELQTLAQKQEYMALAKKMPNSNRLAQYMTHMFAQPEVMRAFDEQVVRGKNS